MTTTVRSECAVRGGVERWRYALIERHLGSQSPKVADFLEGAQHAGAASSNSWEQGHSA